MPEPKLGVVSDPFSGELLHDSLNRVRLTPEDPISWRSPSQIDPSLGSLSPSEVPNRVSTLSSNNQRSRIPPRAFSMNPRGQDLIADRVSNDPPYRNCLRQGVDAERTISAGTVSDQFYDAEEHYLEHCPLVTWNQGFVPKAMVEHLAQS